MCDYSIRLNWAGRSKRSQDDANPFSATAIHFSTFNQAAAPAPPSPHNVRSRSSTSASATAAPAASPSIIQDQAGISDRHQGGYQYQHDGQSSPAVPVDPRIQSVQNRTSADYPPPSNAESPYTMGDGGIKSPMLPPLRMNRPATSPVVASHEHRTKRRRLSPPNDSPVGQSFASSIRQTFAVEAPNAGLGATDAPSPYSVPPATPYSSFVGTPLTPGSSIASDESTLKSGPRSLAVPYQPSPDPRRLSVNDLLIDSTPRERTPRYPNLDPNSGTTTYGHDIGRPDLDTPRNDDISAIALFSPPVSYGAVNYFASERADEQQKSFAFEADGYYAKPVPIKIPKAFEPLPSLLLENRMNLLYFHHFLNHTARILVPHDCEQNPFRNVLPQLAVRDEDLLGLLLAFSASHRARLLCHPEPANRIAVWVQDVFPKLRHALESAQQVSDSSLCTAIMLASLEIIVPNAFEVPIPWQSHLNLARQMIIARGGLQSLNHRDKVAYFLSRWFAYLDVVGSLSGSKNDKPLESGYLVLKEDELRDDQIDCLLGFTNCFVGCLARIAELAKQCEPLRIDATTGNVRDDWHPPADVVAAAEQLRVDLRNSCNNVVYKGCTHGDTATTSASSPSDDATTKDPPWDEAEIYATNEAFHWAGLLHLLRRVLGRPRADAEVQTCVRETLAALARVRPGSSAGACLLFPMFSAGCDAWEEEQRAVILERLKCVEGFGMSQVQKTRELVQRVWATGRAWECLVKGEFFG